MIYQQLLNLEGADFTRIDHDDAMVAIVYKVTQHDQPPLILKICSRTKEYLREVYFLKHFAGALPVPRIIKLLPQENAILMECLPGDVQKDFTAGLAYEMGSLLARIHLHRTEGYGDLTRPESLDSNPQSYFTQEFEEGLAECSGHLPKDLLERCRAYYDAHVHLLDSVDGPCLIHRDFRPGNVIVHDGKLQGIIDWASARASFAEEDFCTLEHGEWALRPASKRPFFAGYSTIRPVPDYDGMMPLLRLSKAIAILGFMVKRGTWESNPRLYQFNRQFLSNIQQITDGD